MVVITNEMRRAHAIIKAMAGCHPKEIIEEQQKAMGDDALKRTAVYEIVKRVKEDGNLEDNRGKFDHKFVRSPELIAEVMAAIEADRRVELRSLAEDFMVSYGTMQTIVTGDLKMVKKSARWVPRLLNDDQKQTRVRCSQQFKELVAGDPGVLERIVTMDETMLSLYTPERKSQSRQWLPKGAPAPVKAKVQESRKKRMILAFFDAGGLIYTRIADPGDRINADFILDTLQRFLRHLSRKRPAFSGTGDWFFHWDNAPVHTARSVADFMAKHRFKLVEHPPYSPDLAPADFFLFPKVKAMLAGQHLEDDGVKVAWEGVTGSIGGEDWLAAFNAWARRCDRCIERDGNYVEK